MSVMDFDLSKENIQPLRGGRNVQQLGVALQAQTNEEYQRELQSQREKFETDIRTYEGDDPLENWYNYISWIEQSYPKHGLEGNLLPLLEDCVAKFEHEEQYRNDRRLCKLFIKFIDLQQNPLELYQMLHSTGLFVGCADMYKAWAFYHEAAGDFTRADSVFKLGQKELAQPYEDLATAYQNMIYAAGQQVVSGASVYQTKLEERRQALISLQTYTSGRVGSTRTPDVADSMTLPPSGSSTTSKPNEQIHVYKDTENEPRGAEALPPASILTVARTRDAPKENVIKPGTWTSKFPQRKPAVHRTPGFKVHDDFENPEPEGIKLPKDFYPVTHEDFSTWESVLCFPEPDDPSRLPMYPKRQVYEKMTENIEFSIEEIKARRYLKKKETRLVVPPQETHQAIQSILGDNNEDMQQSSQEEEEATSHDHQINDQQMFPEQQPQIHQQQLHQEHTLPQFQQNITHEQQPSNIQCNEYLYEHQHREYELHQQHRNSIQQQSPMQHQINQHSSSYNQNIMPQQQPLHHQSPLQHRLEYQRHQQHAHLANQSHHTLLHQSNHQVVQQQHTSVQHYNSMQQHNNSIHTHHAMQHHVSMQQHLNNSMPLHNNLLQHSNPMQQHNNMQQHGNPMQQQTNTMHQHGNAVQQQSNTMQQHNNTIPHLSNTMQQHGNAMPQHGNSMQQHGNAMQQHGNTMQQHSNSMQLPNSSLQQHNSPLQQHNSPLQQHNSPLQQHNSPLQQNNSSLQQHKSLQHSNSFQQQNIQLQHHSHIQPHSPSLHHNNSMHIHNPPIHQHQNSMLHNSLHSPMHNSPQQYHGNMPHPGISQQQPHHSFQQQFAQQKVNQYQDDRSIMMKNSLHELKTPPQNIWQQSVQNFGMPVQSDTPKCNDLNDLWQSRCDEDTQTVEPVISKKPMSHFAIYEESNVGLQKQFQPKGSAMKTPFKIISHDDLAETGSRGGLDNAAAAQPSDSAKRLVIFEDDSNPEDLNTTNTAVFNFNLNAMQVSTPVHNKFGHQISPDDAAKNTRKQLFHEHDAEKATTIFEEKKALSTIFEETKYSGSSSSGGSTSLKSTLSGNKVSTMPVITEDESRYHFNLEQNMKANAALRSSLFGEIMECESQPSSPVIEVPPPKPIDFIPSNPFNHDLLNMLLDRVHFPGKHKSCYHLTHNIPRIIVRKDPMVIGQGSYIIEKLLGKGTYGSVFKALDVHSKQTVAVKLQKPANRWEYYICKELQERLAKHPLRDCFMNVYIGYFNDSASVLISKFSQFGSLLNLVNITKQKTSKLMKQSWCTYFCIEMLSIIEAMHEVKIIHADIKPDNFLVFVCDNKPQLQLIDFGCSIDMSLMPPDTQFMRKVTTEDFICCEMRDDRPWNYHTDYFCVAATAHVLLFDKYIQLQKTGNIWSLTQKFARYHQVDIWNTFFSSLLNMQDGLPDIGYLKSVLSAVTPSTGDLRDIVNLIRNR